MTKKPAPEAGFFMSYKQKCLLNVYLGSTGALGVLGAAGAAGAAESAEEVVAAAGVSFFDDDGEGFTGDL